MLSAKTRPEINSHFFRFSKHELREKFTFSEIKEPRGEKT